ncbi:MAG TPA: nucleotide sugar dehydrogenase, partial [Thermoanaerobaculia bacterium]|nr:nucleotide sugar dehydrogenase [Thermoanaerobaculia bacterium]
MNVSVVGAGKMGLPIAVWIASRGATVWACDKNPDVVAAIEAGEPGIDEPGVAELLREVQAARRLRATTDTTAAIAESDVAIVITPAVLTEAQDADLSNLESASRDIARGLTAGALVIYETTVPVGTTRERLLPILETSGLSAGEELSVAYSPERVKSLTVMSHLDETPKVVGGHDELAAGRAADFYREYLGAPVTAVETMEAAEFVKLAGMIYRDVNIALANQLATYAEGTGLDSAGLFEAANSDGECRLLSPGIGVGGHCTPVYPHFLIGDAARRGIDASLVAGARRTNDEQPERLTARLERHLGGLGGTRVGVLGLGFRPDVKEQICSPTFALVEALRARGAEPRVHDPLYSVAEIEAHGFAAWDPGPPEWRAEALVLVTGHSAFAGLDLAALRDAGLRAVLDGRRFWDAAEVEALG